MPNNLHQILGAITFEREESQGVGGIGV